MAHKEEYLTRAQMQAWSRFLSSAEGKAGMAFLRVGFPRGAFDKSENALIKNAVGFEFWQQCLDRVVNLGELPPKPEKNDDDTLE